MAALMEGDIVHYVLGPKDGVLYPGEHRPAIVVKVWRDGKSAGGACNLQVFMDGGADGTGDGVDLMWKKLAPYDDKKAPYTWHRIEQA